MYIDQHIQTAKRQLLRDKRSIAACGLRDITTAIKGNKANLRRAARLQGRQPPAVRQPPVKPPLQRLPQSQVQPLPPVQLPPPVPEQQRPRAPSVIRVEDDLAPQRQLLTDILDNLSTPAPQSQVSGLTSISNNLDMLKRIKLELYTGDTNIIPWLGKLNTLAGGINGLTTDTARLAYAHLHLAGRALEWFNDKGIHTIPTLKLWKTPF